MCFTKEIDRSKEAGPGTDQGGIMNPYFDAFVLHSGQHPTG